ncbi:MAG: NAD(P)/FAD-dependent oxidoreductase [Dehalococcoidia bacterium]|nr:NAD(P)/FAD-dependent oxidoreductase [Dehalococcoidia bacterium]
MTADVDVAIIGAGVVGLAAAAELSRADARRSVALLERHAGYGRENSSHNSGVVHAGIYFPPDWLKTTLCLEGNRLLYHWAREHGVRARQAGKLIVAVGEGELAELHDVYRRATANGVPGLSLLDERDVRSLEPGVKAAAAILSETSGVIDQMGLMRSLFQASCAGGAHVAFGHEVSAVERSGGGFLVHGAGPGGAPFSLAARQLVNSAGLAAGRIGALLGYDPAGGRDNPPFAQTVSRGCYYDVAPGSAAARVRHLVYPVPPPQREGLGIHLTVDIDGGVHLGPDAEWLAPGDPLDFRSVDRRRNAFLQSAQRYLPALQGDDLVPGQTGYRPKLQRPGEDPRDFLIWHDRGYVHLGGIESPGLTASLAIARRVAAMLGPEGPAG